MWNKKKKEKEEVKPVEEETPDLEVDLNAEPDEEVEEDTKLEPEEVETIEEEPEENIDIEIKKLQEKKKKLEEIKVKEQSRMQITGATLLENGLYQYTAVSNKSLPIGVVIAL